jgi:Rrf2 family protein
MQITRQADYATRAILYLARVGKNERVATSQIAKEQKIPPSFLAKIISQLSIAGLLDTSRGAHGGVSLARAPEQIKLLDVIEAVDGPILLNVCIENKGACELEENCSLQLAWYEIQNSLVLKLRSTNFRELTLQH